ncbi:MAG: ABC transporter substrate-binding protein [Stellaceae bacterium]
MRKIIGIAAAAALVATAASANAAPPLKIGLIMTYSGPFATYGHQADLGVQTYMKAHGDMIAGRKIEIIKKDDTGPHPDVAKRDAQELVTQNHVDLIFGGDWSNDAFASVPVVNEAKIPFINIVAATDGLPQKSPYMARIGLSLSAPSYIMGEWAAKEKGWKTGYNAVVDYILGTAAANAFTDGFKKGGGKIIGEVRMPIGNPDYTPYVQRIKDAHPAVVQLFVPAGSMAEGFVKAYHNIGLLKDGIHLVSGDLSETQPTNTLGDYVNGIYTSTFYIADNKSPANKVFLKAFHAVAGADVHPGFVALEVYDALNVTRQIVAKEHGKLVPKQFMALLDNHQFVSPRGPMAFDKDGEIIENWYLRHAELVNGKMEMKMVKTFHMVHAPVLLHQ